MCGACWAYSVISNIESMIAKKNKTKVTLSTQQMIDCAGNGNNGCYGGDTCSLLSWLTSNNVNIETENEYPTKYEENSTCSARDNQSEYYRVSDFSCTR